MSFRARTDQNLLFGILALQMDFISRDALIAAMHAWVLDKGKPLCQILFEQNALSAEHRTLLEALVAAHLKQHGNDAERSLASVNSLGSLRHDLEQIADADIHASLAYVCLARPVEADPYATRPPTVGEPTSAGTRFRILRPHAKGGLGEVFVANDEELHREVALKEIQDRHADNPDSRARFLREAEITGGLEHPSIVPVYGLGQYADGRPFYAMRFIKGDSLHDAIERFHAAEGPHRDPGGRTLALRQLLGRFVDVCDAIAYAHSRGVLHRDLKPGNVMLGPYGETLVVDWGLAKPLGGQATEENGTMPERPLQPQSSGSATPTQMGSALGTPAYMPPEQAAGQLDRLGPSSDVYSLGATLYCLLTGKAPFVGKEVGEILRKVQAGEFPRPRQVKRDVPAALEAVCLKAMALRPEQRYATPRALAADVERWLADEPVSAYREPWRVRAGRWTRRHHTLVAAAATGIFVVVLAAGLGAWWLDRQRTEQRRGVEAALAEVHRLQQEGRWAEAGAVLEQAKDRLGEGGAHDLREQLEQARRDLELVARLDAIRLKMATVVEGHFDYATADREYAMAFQEAGLGEEGDDSAAVAARIGSSTVKSALVAALDDWAMCTKEKRRAWVLEVARKADPDPERDRLRDPAAWNDRAAFAKMAKKVRAIELPPRLLSVLGSGLKELGTNAEPVLRTAQERFPSDFWVNFELGDFLSTGKPEEAVGYFRVALALRPGTPAVHSNLGNVLHQLHRLDEAIAEFHKAIALDPKIAVVHHNLGNALRDLRRPDEAIAEYNQAIVLDPKFARPHNGLGVALYDKGRVDEAIAEYKKAISLDPKYAQPHNNLGYALYKLHRMDEAIAEFHKAIALDPKYTQPQNNLGNVLRDLRRLDEAIAEHKKGIDLDPKNAYAHNDLGNALRDKGLVDEAIAEYQKAIILDPKIAELHHNLGNSLHQLHRVDEAIAEYHKAIELNPKLARPHTNLGNALWGKGQVEQAIAEYMKAIALDPNDAYAHNGLGAALRNKGRVDEAMAEYKKAIELAPKLARPHNGLGLTLRDKGRVDEAIVEYNKAIELDPKDAAPYDNLGDVLRDLHRLDEAIAKYKKAIALDPKDAYAHTGLGNALSDKGRLDEAIAEYNKAITLDPKLALPHNGLGIALRDKGRLDEAIAEYNKAITLDPKDAYAHNGLGSVLRDKGRMDEAVAEYKKAIALDPKYARAHGNLGVTILQQGQFTEARQSIQHCLELLPANHSDRSFFSQHQRECEQMLILDKKLAAILKGETNPANVDEQIGLARLCQIKKRYAAAARFFADAFTAQPKLADNLLADPRHRYNAACFAALAAAGQGEDAGKLDDKERARLRKQALDWLRADLALWSKQIEKGKPQDRATAQKKLRHWQQDTDLAGLRDSAALDKLPENERAECRKLWHDVAALLKR